MRFRIKPIGNGYDIQKRSCFIWFSHGEYNFEKYEHAKRFLQSYVKELCRCGLNAIIIWEKDNHA